MTNTEAVIIMHTPDAIEQIKKALSTLELGKQVWFRGHYKSKETAIDAINENWDS